VLIKQILKWWRLCPHSVPPVRHTASIFRANPTKVGVQIKMLLIIFENAVRQDGQLFSLETKDDYHYDTKIVNVLHTFLPKTNPLNVILLYSLERAQLQQTNTLTY
jgi:hypothetical protein